MSNTKNQVPLQKQLIPLNLSGGLDERTRSELGAAIVTMDNLLQQEAGAWSIRPGLTAFPTNAEIGGSVGPGLELIRLQNNAIGTVSHLANASNITTAQLNHLQSSGKLRRKGTLPEFSVTGKFSSSAQISYTTAIVAAASSSKYDVVVYQWTDTGGSKNGVMSITDRDTGSEVAKYGGLAAKFGVGIAYVQATFVSDRYLHVYVQDGGIGDHIKHIQLDTNSSLPADLSAVTVTDVGASGATVAIYDICSTNASSSGNARSFLAADGFIYSVDTALALVSTAFSGTAESCDVDDNGNVIVAGVDGATGRVRVTIYPTVSMAASHNWVDGTVTPAGIVMIASLQNGTIGLIDYKSNDTFGGTTTYKLTYYTATAAATALTKQWIAHTWMPTSQPFRCIATNKIYQHWSKIDENNTLSCSVIVCLDDFTSTSSGILSKTYTSVRLAASLENNLAITPTVPLRIRYVPYGTTEKISAVTSYQVTARTMAFPFYQMIPKDKNQWESCNFGGSTYITSGCLSVYDGFKPVEAGFVDMPKLNVADSGNAGNPDGSYKYLCVFKHVNNQGEVTYSKTYGPQSVTVATHKVTVTIQACHVTNKDTGIIGDQPVIVELYRTASGGTQYFLCGSSQTTTAVQQISLSATDAFLTLADNLSDVSLAANPPMFRQPGTQGTPLDRFPPQTNSVLTVLHKDRVWTADPYGRSLCYSSFFVDGETAWFSPGFSIFVHGGSGPITGIASMDGRLFVFKRDAIFVVDGDGPAEDGGNGTEFTPPQRLATDFGCINQKSVLVTPDGLIFQSSRGWEMLSRALQVEWIGSRVQKTAALYSSCVGTAIDARGRVYLAVNKDSSHGKVLVYDSILKCWSTMTLTMVTGVGGNIDGIALGSYLGNDVVFVLAGSTMYFMDSTTNTDNTSEVDGTVETGWIHGSGPQGRQYLDSAFLLLSKKDSHRVEFSAAHDYVETYVKTETWEPQDQIDLVPEEVQIQLENPESVATKLKVKVAWPSDTVLYPITTGAGADILDLSVYGAQKDGPQNLPSTGKA